jgi:hypothetical protein
MSDEAHALWRSLLFQDFPRSPIAVSEMLPGPGRRAAG